MEIKALHTWITNDNEPLIISGPCGAETREQVFETAKLLHDIKSVKLFRAGIWKPRTRPNSFEGVGEEGLIWLKEVQKQFGLKTTVEVANAQHTELALKHGVDVLWIGARTTGNPFSVQEIADVLTGVDIPVFIKNEALCAWHHKFIVNIFTYLNKFVKIGIPLPCIGLNIGQFPNMYIGHSIFDINVEKYISSITEWFNKMNN